MIDEIQDRMLAGLGISRELIFGEHTYSVSSELLRIQRVPIHILDIADLLERVNPYWGA